MIIYKVSIPEDKQSFFQEFLDLIGADYEKPVDYQRYPENEEQEIPDWQVNEAQIR